MFTPVITRHDATLEQWQTRFSTVHLDLGTGDGAFALDLARRNPDLGVLGVDTCLDNIRVKTRRLPTNLRLLTADAWTLPPLTGDGYANRITVNFPYGSLLRGLVGVESDPIGEIGALAAPDALIEIRINASALAEIGLDLESGRRALQKTLGRLHGWTVAIGIMSQTDLRAFPSTWAKRIGYGRNTSALLATARRR